MFTLLMDHECIICCGSEYSFTYGAYQVGTYPGRLLRLKYWYVTIVHIPLSIGEVNLVDAGCRAKNIQLPNMNEDEVTTTHSAHLNTTQGGNLEMHFHQLSS